MGWHFLGVNKTNKKMYVAGKLANTSVQGVRYQNGIVLNGVDKQSKKTYVAGKLANAMVNGVLYKKRRCVYRAKSHQ